MDHMCAIIDAQGFIKNKKFIPREIAIASDSMLSMCFEIDPEIDTADLTSEEKLSNEYVRKAVHGLAMKPKTTKYLSVKEIPALLRYLHDITKTRPTDTFGIKNPQLAQLLKEYNIPYVELSSPKLEILTKYYGSDWLCSYHSESDKGRCALRKVNYLKRWFKEKEYMSKFINSVYSLY